MFNYVIKLISYTFRKILAWDTTESLNTNTILPPVNPWDVASSEPVESTGWANFENFENTLSIDNTTSEDKKTTCDELKKTSETTAVDLTEKNIAFSESFENEKSRDCISNEVIEKTDLPVMETNLSSSTNKSDENKISVDENISSNKLDNRYLYTSVLLRLEYNLLEICIVNCRNFKNVRKIENVKKDKIFECRHLLTTNTVEEEKPSTEVSVAAASLKSTPNDSTSMSKDIK